MDISELRRKPLAELIAMAEELQLPATASRRRQDLIFHVERALLEAGTPLEAEGTLELGRESFGFLRSPDYSYLPGPDDIYVSQTQIKRFQVKTGDTIRGQVRPPKAWEKYLALLQVDSINGLDPEAIKGRVA
ncbi:MAG: Rho termination factor N-terminal domain-containing protein, partial [Gemmatimonadota bacterium]|nr:Rho termination factor N-terminal domain-containing protein [Gemmatimonadota bacterium]